MTVPLFQVTSSLSSTQQVKCTFCSHCHYMNVAFDCYTNNRTWLWCGDLSDVIQYVRLPLVTCSAWSDWLADLYLTSVFLREHTASTPLQQYRDISIMIQQMAAEMSPFQFVNESSRSCCTSLCSLVLSSWSVQCILPCAAGRGCKPAPAVLSTLCCVCCRWPQCHDPV